MQVAVQRLPSCQRPPPSILPVPDRTFAPVRATWAGAQHQCQLLWQKLRGRPQRLNSPDRRLLEDRLLPALAAAPTIRRTLFCGSAAYTQHYEKIFRGGEFWTLDPHPRLRRYGARRHIVDRLQNLLRNDVGGEFDLIVCNGVIGWGLDDARDIEDAMAACHLALRQGGCLLLGWNDVYPRNRVRPKDVTALRRFEHIGFRGFPRHIVVDGPECHVYDFFRKPLH